MLDHSTQSKIANVLFFLRLGVGLVFIVWVMDKFINPAHTAAIYESFYMISSLSDAGAYAIGGVQLILVLAFIAGALKKYSYLAIFLMHAVSTLGSYSKYFDPYSGANILFFAAIPMLAACWALWALKEYDTVFSVDASRANA